jgi:RNA-binding protein YhbY
MQQTKHLVKKLEVHLDDHGLVKLTILNGHSNQNDKSNQPY